MPRSLPGRRAAAPWSWDPSQAGASGQGQHWGWQGREGDFTAHKLLILIKNYFRLHLAGATKPGSAAKLSRGPWGAATLGTGLEEDNAGPVAKGTPGLSPPWAMSPPSPLPPATPHPSRALPLAPAPSVPHPLPAPHPSAPEPGEDKAARSPVAGEAAFLQIPSEEPRSAELSFGGWGRALPTRNPPPGALHERQSTRRRDCGVRALKKCKNDKYNGKGKNSAGAAWHTTARPRETRLLPQSPSPCARGRDGTRARAQLRASSSRELREGAGAGSGHTLSLASVYISEY